MLRWPVRLLLATALALPCTPTRAHPADVAPGSLDAGTQPPTWRVAGDGAITIADAIIVLRATVGLHVMVPGAGVETARPGDVSPGFADASVMPAAWHVMGDGVVGIADAIVVLRATVGLHAIEYAEAPVLTAVVPATAPVGAVVEISGSGFGDDPSQLDLVFNTSLAPVTSIRVAGPGDERLLVTVPPGATSGPLSLQRFGRLSNVLQFAVDGLAWRSVPVPYATAGEPWRYEPDVERPDASPLAFSLVVSPPAASVDPDTGAIAWTPQQADEGLNAFVLSVTDGSRATTQAFQVQVEASVPEAVATIGAAGGTLVVSDASSPLAGTRLEIPPGALLTPTVVRLESVRSPAWFPPGFPLLRITPDAALAVPARLVLKIPPGLRDLYGMPAGDPIAVASFDPVTRDLTEVPGAEDPVRGEVSAPLPHFSMYTLAEIVVGAGTRVLLERTHLLQPPRWRFVRDGGAGPGFGKGERNALLIHGFTSRFPAGPEACTCPAPDGCDAGACPSGHDSLACLMRFAMDEYDNVATWDYPSLLPIEVNRAWLEDAMRREIGLSFGGADWWGAGARRLGANFDVIAHSEGGLLARAVLEEPRDGWHWRGACRLVTLGTPHHGAGEIDRGFNIPVASSSIAACLAGQGWGDAMAAAWTAALGPLPWITGVSELADFGHPLAPLEMIGGSAFLRALNARERNPHLRYLLVAGDQDCVACAGESSDGLVEVESALALRRSRAAFPAQRRTFGGGRDVDHFHLTEPDVAGTSDGPSSLAAWLREELMLDDEPGRTLHVSASVDPLHLDEGRGDASFPSPSIDRAVCCSLGTSAGAADTIDVEAGTYEEWPTVVIDHPLTLRGAGADACHVTSKPLPRRREDLCFMAPLGLHDGDSPLVDGPPGQAAGAVIDGLHVDGRSNDCGAQLVVIGDRPSGAVVDPMQVRSCRFSLAGDPPEYGAWIEAGSAMSVEDSSFEGPSGSYAVVTGPDGGSLDLALLRDRFDGAGVSVGAARRVVVQGSTFTGGGLYLAGCTGGVESALVGGSVQDRNTFTGASSGLVLGCPDPSAGAVHADVRSNQLDGALLVVLDTADVTASANAISGAGVVIGHGGGAPLSLVFTGNSVSGNPIGLLIYGAPPTLVVSGNAISGNAVDAWSFSGDTILAYPNQWSSADPVEEDCDFIRDETACCYCEGPSGETHRSAGGGQGEVIFVDPLAYISGSCTHDLAADCP